MIDVYWLEQTEEDVPAENDWLSVNEAAHLNSLRFPKRRTDWRLGRWTAKRALALWWGVPDHHEALAEIEIRQTEGGAPGVFLANEPASITISITHRGGHAACAVTASGASLGCDLEIVEPRSDEFIADYFAAEEQALIAQAPASDRNRLSALFWSGKESTLKAMHVGLRLDTRGVIVRPALVFDSSDGFGNWRSLHVRYADQIFIGWWQQTDDFLRTLVAASSSGQPIVLE